jgi:hypothetical protein
MLFVFRQLCNGFFTGFNVSLRAIPHIAHARNLRLHLVSSRAHLRRSTSHLRAAINNPLESTNENARKRRCLNSRGLEEPCLDLLILSTGSSVGVNPACTRVCIYDQLV